MCIPVQYDNKYDNLYHIDVINQFKGSNMIM